MDCESTGLDVYHGARPFLVSVYDGKKDPVFWPWKVDPKTRKVSIPHPDVKEIQKFVEKADRIVFQNCKFDIAMFREAGIVEDWPWEKTEDTLVAGHVLRSNQAHDLTTMSLVYLGKNIQPYEDEMEKVVKKARNYYRRYMPEWRIAKEGLPEMPSARGDLWKNDMWLLQHYEDGKHFHLVEAYATVDPWVTYHLWEVFEEKLREEGLWEIYRERMRCVPVTVDMERRGVTLSRKRLEEQSEKYRVESVKSAKMCQAIAATYGYDLQLPKSGNNGSLSKFCFGSDVITDEISSVEYKYLDLPVVAKSKKTGAPTFDKAVVDYYLSTLDEDGKQWRFVKALSDKRKRDTAVQYMAGYQKFWLPLGMENLANLAKVSQKELLESVEWFVLHPSLNMTGTDTLRWSSSNPNEQNISKKEGFNLRYAFGPAPGREWHALDYENIERRIPAYEAGEDKIIQLFEDPDSPPFYGSEHLLNASIIFPDLFWPLSKKGMHKDEFKKQPWYRPTKNTGFAIQYGCMEAKADATAGRSGAYKTLRAATPKIFKLNDYYVELANRQGYVETLPDRSIGAERGYPIWCSRSSWGGVSPTVPFNYHIQSTACWATAKAMVRCYDQLNQWQEQGVECRLVMQIHDELVFEFPSNLNNSARVRRLRKLMEMSGDDIGIPLKTSASYHPENWANESEYRTKTKTSLG